MVCTTMQVFSWKGVGAQLEVSGLMARSGRRPFSVLYDEAGDSRLTRRFKGLRRTRWRKWRGLRGLVLRELLTGVYRGGRRLRVWDVLVALGNTGTRQHFSDVRQITWSRGGPSSGTGVTLSCRNRRKTVPGAAGLRQAIPTAWRHDLQGNEGGMERRCGATYRRGSGRKRPGIYGN
jgi:hypothetical protein